MHIEEGKREERKNKKNFCTRARASEKRVPLEDDGDYIYIYNILCHTLCFFLFVRPFVTAAAIYTNVNPIFAGERTWRAHMSRLTNRKIAGLNKRLQRNHYVRAVRAALVRPKNKTTKKRFLIICTARARTCVSQYLYNNMII